MQALKNPTRKYVVVAVDGYNRVIEIQDKKEIEVRNHLHYRNTLQEIEDAANAKSNELKSERIAAIRCIPVSTFRNVNGILNSVAAGLNSVFKADEKKRQAATQDYLQKLAAKKAAKAAQKAQQAANSQAIVLYKPICNAIVKA